MVHLAGVAGLDHQADLRPRLFPHQVMVHGRDQQQGRDRGPLLGGVAVREHDEVRSPGDGLGHPAPHHLDGASQGLAAGGGGRAGFPGLTHLEQAVDGEGRKAGRLSLLVDVEQLGQVVAVDDRLGQQDLRQLPGRACSRLPSGPMVAPREVTSSSRMASRGGLVTWAKSWVK